MELPAASENVLSLDGTWRFALHTNPRDALGSRFFRDRFVEASSSSAAAAHPAEPRPAGDNVRGADGQWRDVLVPGCWQLQVCGACYSSSARVLEGAGGRGGGEQEVLGKFLGMRRGWRSSFSFPEGLPREMVKQDGTSMVVFRRVQVCSKEYGICDRT